MTNKPSSISLIIAFYNEELYLDRCLQSVANQTYKNIEVILINDGSTDDSLQIAEKYLKAFESVKLISIENSGPAEARNKGLKNSTSKYVTFLDADDTLVPNMMQVFISEIEATNADLLLCDFHIFSEDGKTEMPSKWHSLYRKIKSSNELATIFYREGIVETIWSKVFLTSIAKQITFDNELKLFDDRPFVLEFILLSKTVSFIPQKLINNYCRKSSLTRRVLSEVRVKDVYRLFELELNVVKRYGVENEFKFGVFKNALDYFMDTFLIQIIDKNDMESLHKIRNLYQKLLLSFCQKTKSEQIKFNKKNQLALFLLRLPNYLGWRFSNLILFIAKNKRLQAIKKIKNIN